MKLQDKSHKEEDICGSCKKAFTEDESAIKCEGICRQWRLLGHHPGRIRHNEEEQMKTDVALRYLQATTTERKRTRRSTPKAEPKGRPYNAGTNKGYEGNDGKRLKKDERPEYGNKANGQQGKAAISTENESQEWESNRTLKVRERKYRKRNEERGKRNITE
jgi:hypothetical protein